jgi:hypothetical protein
MPKQGEIRVQTTATEARECALWLRQVVIPARQRMSDTLLTPGKVAESVGRLKALAEILSKSASWKRASKASYVINVPRGLAEVFPLEETFYYSPWRIRAPRSLEMLAEEVRRASRAKRGRPSLKLAESGIRVDRSHVVDERFRQRLARRLRAEAAWLSWCAELNARDETLLTATLPLPKI